MKLSLLLLGPVLLIPALLLSPQPPACKVEVRQIDRDDIFQQINVLVAAVPLCPLEGRAVIRFRTVGGGILPAIGYTVLKGSYPRKIGFWLRRGASVEQNLNGKWKTVWRSGE